MRFLLSFVLLIFSGFIASGQSAGASLNITLSEIQSLRIDSHAQIEHSEDNESLDSSDIQFILSRDSEVKKVLSPSGGGLLMQVFGHVNQREISFPDSGNAEQYVEEQSDQSADMAVLMYLVYPR